MIQDHAFDVNVQVRFIVFVMTFKLKVLYERCFFFVKDWLVPKASVIIMQMQKNLPVKESSREIVSANQVLLVQGAIVVS